jgi:hypothetical protein
MRTSESERDDVLRYFASELPNDPVVHVEKVASERVGSTVHDIWDVHCKASRWWAVSNPLNLYSQADFKSRDVVLTFHVGLAMRMATLHAVPITDHAAALLPGVWRRWELAVEAFSAAKEAEDFQAIGVRLRECLVSFAAEIANEDLVAAGAEAPKAADVVAWMSLLAGRLASGSSAEHLRSYLKKMARETWEYVNWLTHAKNARHEDAEFGLSAVSHLLASFTSARLRWARGGGARCDECGSYSIGAGMCQRCGWSDPDWKEPAVPETSEEESDKRPAGPCTPSSDISTLITLDDLTRRRQGGA